MAETRPFADVVAAGAAPAPAIPKTQASAPAAPASSSPSTAPEVLAGKQLGHFRVDSLIAEGGMGAVYRGFDLSLSRPVAIKVIRSELAADERFLAIFLREAQAQANVVHSHVLQAYYVGEAHGIWFLAMQVVDGGSLEDLLAGGKTLGWKDAARHMTAVVAGMAEAARLGIVHRDIKPANILLDRFGDAHVADFGLATSTGLLPVKLGDVPTGPRSRRPGTTQPGAIMGTPEYMPPEQLAGQPLDERADIYAIGASFYQLIVGRLPYPITDVPTAMAALRGPPPPCLRDLRPEVPKAFAELIDRCIARSADDRPESLAVLLELLRKAGPRPEVTPSPLVRVMSLMLDVAPFAAIYVATLKVAPWLAFPLLAAWLTWGLATLSATPGQWLMRLWLRSPSGGDVPLFRALLRSAGQLGWLVLAAICFSSFRDEIRLSSAVGATLEITTVAWALVSLFGSLLALGPRRQTLHDRLSRTRVLVATEG